MSMNEIWTTAMVDNLWRMAYLVGCVTAPFGLTMVFWRINMTFFSEFFVITIQGCDRSDGMSTPCHKS
jgi:hypothetical protein